VNGNGPARCCNGQKRDFKDDEDTSIARAQMREGKRWLNLLRLAAFACDRSVEKNDSEFPDRKAEPATEKSELRHLRLS
jgi:hypothetical protein